MDEEAVFRALSNRWRRRILDLLALAPMTTGELAEQVGDLSRFSVMQHLGVLEQAGLVISNKEGRRKVNHLNAVPIQLVYERWVTKLARGPAEAATALKRYVEGKEQTSE